MLLIKVEIHWNWGSRPNSFSSFVLRSTVLVSQWVPKYDEIIKHFGREGCKKDFWAPRLIAVNYASWQHIFQKLIEIGGWKKIEMIHTISNSDQRAIFQTNRPGVAILNHIRMDDFFFFFAIWTFCAYRISRKLIK